MTAPRRLHADSDVVRCAGVAVATLPSMSYTDWDEQEDDAESGSEFRAALDAGDFDRARALAEERAIDPAAPDWLVTSMFEDVGLSLAHAGRHDEAIAVFERALALGWDVVPDGRCEIARVLLLAGRDRQADALWSELRAADPDGLWMLNAGGMAYGEVGRDEEAVEWLAAGLRIAIDRDDPEHIVDQMSDARRVGLRRLGRGLDGLEREVEAFRARARVRRQTQLDELRVAARASGTPVRGSPITAAWVTEDDDRVARERWPGWLDSLVHDDPSEQRCARMERELRRRRRLGDGPIVVVTVDLERYEEFCAEREYEPVDSRSRASFATAERERGAGREWPPGRNEAC